MYVSLLAIAVLCVGCVAPAAAQVVVMGNPQTGAYVVVYDRSNPVEAAEAAARKKDSNGDWRTLLASEEPGRGSMFCLKTNGRFEFFLVHGKASAEEAVTESRALARQAAASQGGMPYWCGAWNNTNRHPLGARVADTTRVTRNYDGVIVTFTLGKTPSGTVVLAQARNSNEHRAATLRFVGIDPPNGRVLTLQPGERANVPLGHTDGFVIEVQLHPPSAAERPGTDRALDALKEIIREQISVGADRIGTVPVGVRG